MYLYVDRTPESAPIRLGVGLLGWQGRSGEREGPAPVREEGTGPVKEVEVREVQEEGRYAVGQL